MKPCYLCSKATFNKTASDTPCCASCADANEIEVGAERGIRPFEKGKPGKPQVVQTADEAKALFEANPCREIKVEAPFVLHEGVIDTIKQQFKAILDSANNAWRTPIFDTQDEQS